MLRRSDKPQTTAPAAAPTEPPAGGAKAPNQAPKGYATPSRKEAEAARKARLGALPADPKERRKAVNAQRSSQYQIERRAIREGDARNYPARDFGPARAFVRDYVDGRLRILEFTLPVVVVCYGIILFGRSSVSASLIALYLMTISMFSLIVFGLMLSNRVKKAVGEKFGLAEARGTGLYAFSRAVNPRFLRKPKPVVTTSGQPKV
ncbi:MAG TPA: DUF3043 domain-containing protein [Actinocrinis sp.]|nr:DUF3043 domain-containing protein [Actinocrinis sp.]